MDLGPGCSQNSFVSRAFPLYQLFDKLKQTPALSLLGFGGGEIPSVDWRDRPLKRQTTPPGKWLTDDEPTTSAT